jgi:hypothetical protein
MQIGASAINKKETAKIAKFLFFLGVLASLVPWRLRIYKSAVSCIIAPSSYSGAFQPYSVSKWESPVYRQVFFIATNAELLKERICTRRNCHSFTLFATIN